MENKPSSFAGPPRGRKIQMDGEAPEFGTMCGPEQCSAAHRRGLRDPEGQLAREV